MAINFGNLTDPQPLLVFDTVLGSTTSASQGAGAIGYSPALTYPAGTVGAALAGSGIGSSTGLRQTLTATAGQTLFTLTTIAYTVGNNSLNVFVDGLLQLPTDYTETSSTSVTFSAGLLAGQQVSFVTGSFSTIGSGKFSVSDTAATATDIASFDFQRHVEYSGGTFGFVNGCVRAITFVDNAGATDFEWALMGILQNHATAGQNVGVYAQGNKYSTGPTWGATAEAIDWTAQNNPNTGLVGLEVDCRANGTDNNNSRLGIDIVINRQQPSLAANVVAWGVRIQNGGDPGSSVTVGFDTSAVTVLQAAYKMGQNQSLAFNANATRQLLHNGSSFIFSNPGVENYWALNDNLSITANGVQIIGTRVTGYTAMTGVVNRGTSYDPSIITLQQLAQRVAAIQADLTTHGLIGA